MEQAISLAEKGMLQGDGGPFGAVIVKKGIIVGSGWNKVIVTNDPTAHAEIVAIRDACSRLNTYWLDECHIYATCEPCPMCLSAIYWARLSFLYYAATRKDAASIGFNDNLIYDEINLSAENRMLKSCQIDREKSIEIMQQWLNLDTKHPY
jgi:tRNA(Arg) A34 adenosine deaminase TadA